MLVLNESRLCEVIPEHIEQTFARLLMQAQPALQGYVSSQIPDPLTVEDVLQEVAGVLWEKFEDFELGTNFVAWSISIARYKVLHAKRAYARRRLLLSDELLDRAAAYFSACTLEEDTRRLKALRECVQGLGEHQQGLLQAFYAESRSCIVIAETLGRTPVQVRKQLSRLRQALRRCITKYIEKRDWPPLEDLS